MLSNELESCLNQGFQYARAQRHEFLTVEHLLRQVLEAPSVEKIIRSCGADPFELQQRVTQHLEENASLLEDAEREVVPTLAFQRVLQRAVFAVQAAGRREITAAHVLLTLLTEKQSAAADLLIEAGITREQVARFVPDPHAEMPELQPLQARKVRDDIDMMARRFAATHLSPHVSRWDENAEIALEVLRQSAARSLLGLVVRPVNGGAGVRWFEALHALEVLSASCTSIAIGFALHNVVAWAVDRFGSDKQHASWLQRLLTAEQLATHCHWAPKLDLMPPTRQVHATLSDGGYVLNGGEPFVPAAGAADVYMFTSHSGVGPNALNCILASKETHGLSVGTRQHTLGLRSLSCADIEFDGCIVPAENRLGAVGAGLAIATATAGAMRLSMAACALGPAVAALELAQRFAQTHGGLNREIGFRFADRATDLEAARALLQHTAREFERAPEAASALTCMAKQFAVTAASRIIDEALQMHGADGYSKNLPLERWFRDVRALQIFAGTNEDMRRAIAQDLLRLDRS